MAKKDMTPIKADFNEITKVTLEAATTAADGMGFKLPASDEYVVILVENTDASTSGTISVKVPTNGGYAAATSDLSATLAAGDKAVIRIESAKYADNLGNILLVPSATSIKACVIY